MKSVPSQVLPACSGVETPPQLSMDHEHNLSNSLLDMILISLFFYCRESPLWQLAPENSSDRLWSRQSRTAADTGNWNDWNESRKTGKQSLFESLFFHELRCSTENLQSRQTAFCVNAPQWLWQFIVILPTALSTSFAVHILSLLLLYIIFQLRHPV